MRLDMERFTNRNIIGKLVALFNINCFSLSPQTATIAHMKTSLTLPHGTLRLPVFLPDGTQGVVRSVDTADLTTCGIQAVQMNGYHLMQRPGSST
ncbi:MAG: hypothetical protein KC421_08390, partial [Anaerolineales bacterium]|nr:hypothetical protein [Anaerolineales bacterium]